MYNNIFQEPITPLNPEQQAIAADVSDPYYWTNKHGTIIKKERI